MYAYLCGVLDQEPTRDWRVCVEADFELAKKREQVGFDMSGDGIIVSLENGGEDGVRGGLDVVDFLDGSWFEVGEAEL